MGDGFAFAGTQRYALAQKLELAVHERLPRYEMATARRRKPERVKESIVRFKGYENKVLVGEDITEIEYQPRKCARPYRLIIVRKNIREGGKDSGPAKLSNAIQKALELYRTGSRRACARIEPTNSLSTRSFMLSFLEWENNHGKRSASAKAGTQLSCLTLG